MCCAWILIELLPYLKRLVREQILHSEVSERGDIGYEVAWNYIKGFYEETTAMQNRHCYKQAL